ncbi:MAG: hypothetical protein MUP69_10275 [Candidatus Atribacteria bacterium]|nr:hypothetical protein [Candidatus Atribacteria bacterium]
MKTYLKKVSHTLLLGLGILLIITVIYLVYPKYQIISNSGSIYKVNKITGQVTSVYTPNKTLQEAFRKLHN